MEANDYKPDKVKRKISEDEENTGKFQKIKIAANKNYEDMVIFFITICGFSLTTSERYTSLLIRNNIATISRLKWTLKNDRNILNKLDFDPEHVKYLLLLKLKDD